MLQISRLAGANVNFEPSPYLPSSGLVLDQKVRNKNVYFGAPLKICKYGEVKRIVSSLHTVSIGSRRG
jgi:hypothetical protein